MQDFAGPLPALVIAEMFGLPRTDRQQIGRWSNAISSVIHRDLMAERFGSGAEAMMEFAEYLQGHFDRVRKTPTTPCCRDWSTRAKTVICYRMMN